MENYLEFKDQVLLELSDTYNKLKFECLITKFNINISTFFVIGLPEYIEENDNWQKISEDIALKFQSKITSLFDKWNIYIIYVATDKIKKDLKNRIETDKFSSRKIVEENFTCEFTEYKANELIIKHITNFDLCELIIEPEMNINKNKTNTTIEYIPNNIHLWNLISKEDIKGNKEFQEKILSDLVKSLYNED